MERKFSKKQQEAERTALPGLLFHGLEDEELQQLSEHIGMRRRSYEKNETVMHMGDRVHEIGTVLSGSVNIESIDVWGNRSILSNVGRGHIFAETYALCGEPLMVDVAAAEQTEVLLIDVGNVRNSPDSGMSWHRKFMDNLLMLSARKNLTLSARIFCTSARTVRGRLLTYLSEQARANKSMTFEIPFDRQQLADYLNLDRSAVSKELGKMQKEGLIEFRKNRFTLKQGAEG